MSKCFRAWDNDKNEWLKGWTISPCGLVLVNAPADNGLNSPANATLEQWANKLDINQNKLFDGDIFKSKSHDPSTYRIISDNGSFWALNDSDIHNYIYPIELDHFYDTDFTDVEKIGNIHEHAHLLEGE